MQFVDGKLFNVGEVTRSGAAVHWQPPRDPPPPPPAHGAYYPLQRQQSVGLGVIGLGEAAGAWGVAGIAEAAAAAAAAETAVVAAAASSTTRWPSSANSGEVISSTIGGEAAEHAVQVARAQHETGVIHRPAALHIPAAVELFGSAADAGAPRVSAGRPTHPGGGGGGEGGGGGGGGEGGGGGAGGGRQPLGVKRLPAGSERLSSRVLVFDSPHHSAPTSPGTAGKGGGRRQRNMSSSTSSSDDCSHPLGGGLHSFTFQLNLSCA